MERAKRIELSSQPWQGRVLPLNHARKIGTCIVYQKQLTNATLFFLLSRCLYRTALFPGGRLFTGHRPQ